MAERLPLEGVRVVDISNLLAGPTTGMHLADFGADVIKVERPGKGDEFRRWGYEKNGVGLYFKMLNRNKRSVTADLHTPIGVEIVKRLVRDADIVIENYRPGTLEKWGLGYEVLREINRGIILLRITGYGQDGPYRNKPGFGSASDAYGGAAYVIGYPDRPPLLPGFSLGDASSGIGGAFLAMVALRERDASGEGQVVDLALYETLFNFLGPMVMDYDQLGIVHERSGSRTPWASPRNIYRCRDDRYVVVSAGSQAIFARLCGALDIPEAAQDERFATHQNRMRYRDELDDLLQRAIERWDQSEVVARIEAADAVVGPVQSVADIVEDPHMLERGSIVTVEDEDLGPLRMQSVLGKMSRTPGSVRATGPGLGEHNTEILIGQLGFTADELDAAGIPHDASAPPFARDGALR